MPGLKPKIAVAVSGQGRTLQNFLQTSLAFDVGAVIGSNSRAPALDLARKAALPIFIDDFKAVDPKTLNDWLIDQGISWIALAGFLRPFPLLSDFSNRVINIHPSLLPRYGGHGMYGIRVHAAVLAAREAFTGATVHFVNERYDEGSIIAQARTAIGTIQSAEELAAEVFALECEFYPEVLSRLLNHQLPLNEGRIWHFERDTPCTR